MSARPRRFDRTEDGDVVVPVDLAGPVAAVLRMALDRYRRENGGAVIHSTEPAMRQLVDALAEAHRNPPLPSPATRHSDSAWLTVDEVAERSGVAPRTVRWRCADGRIPGARRAGPVWLIPADTADALERDRWTLR